MEKRLSNNTSDHKLVCKEGAMVWTLTGLREGRAADNLD